MPALTNVSGAMFVLPDGTEIPNGESADVEAETLEIAGVAQMVEAGKLTVEEPKRGRPPKVASESETE
jgi:hypothetical protein